MKLIVIGWIALTFSLLGKRVDHFLKKGGLKADFHALASVYVLITWEQSFFPDDGYLAIRE
jgi:hypothetical protein